MNKFFSTICAIIMFLGVTVKAEALIIIDQSAYSTDNSSRISQLFTDYPDYSAYDFDDFDAGSNYYIDLLTIYGYETGSSGYNVDIIGEIWDGLPGSYGGSMIMSSVSGTQSGSDLAINFGGQYLPAGNNYWITAYVKRPYSTGGQWFWHPTGSVNNGSNAYFYNPGGAFGFGTDPIPDNTIFSLQSDMALKLEGRDAGNATIPEPSTIALFTIGSLAAFLRRKK